MKKAIEARSGKAPAFLSEINTSSPKRASPRKVCPAKQPPPKNRPMKQAERVISTIESYEAELNESGLEEAPMANISFLTQTPVGDLSSINICTGPPNGANNNSGVLPQIAESRAEKSSNFESYQNSVTEELGVGLPQSSLLNDRYANYDSNN
mmetsp:Transcript_21212/g.32866  ORF Transcript_21212/g.32866 Transcript_21212/m.32866 type:complete len:153 (-) Transcript_21212:2151-2609(-)|eukprot:CAMPEP_0170512686 /NCGR_PEP_ID=MMETSP0208-20121228/66987_1 /TAXON_ID=197538 /ORGANISM="Strombidium inclinatum, Strain S3" /LENGTH=152 /DNA_ID=CAMNT_0010796341 /DNA_START=103 /DNA_END=561 /DNA_ORIENTATION=+